MQLDRPRLGSLGSLEAGSRKVGSPEGWITRGLIHDRLGFPWRWRGLLVGGSVHGGAHAGGVTRSELG